MKKLILIGLIMVIILISGCVQEAKFTPAKPEMMFDTLTVYGTLEDYTTENNITTFKIKSEIVNCELNNTKLEIVADTSKLKELYLTEICNYTNVEQLEIGKEYKFYTDESHHLTAIYNGTVTINDNKYISFLDTGTVIPLNFLKAEYINSTLLANSSFFIKNEKYLFTFIKKSEEKVWNRIYLEKDVNKIKEM